MKIMSRPTKELSSPSQNRSLLGLIFATVIITSLSLFLSINIVNSRTTLIIIALLIATVLGLIVYHSINTWIPIMICLLLVRDFHLGSIIGEGTLKIGDIFIVYLFLLWLIREFLIKKSTRFLKSKLDFCIVLFVFIHAFSLLWSTDIEYGLLRVFKLIRNVIFYIIMRELFINDFLGSYKKATTYYIITGIVLLAVHMGIVLMFGGFYDFLSFYQKETLTSTDLGALRVRATGGGFLITGPAMWLFIAAILTFGSLMLTNSRAVKTLKISLIILFVLGATLTLQRSFVVMAIIMFVFLLIGSLYLKYKKNIVTISIILVAFVVIGSALGLTNIFEKRFENAFEDSSWVIRTEFYASAVDAFRHSPILGIGAGSNYSWLQTHANIGDETRIVHSAYLLVLSEVGMLGFLIFLFMIYFWIKYLLDCIRNSNRMPYMRVISMTLFAFSASYFVYIVQVGEFEDFEVWFVMAIASAIKNLDLASIGTVKDSFGKRCADVC